jgi:hypothetical protein
MFSKCIHSAFAALLLVSTAVSAASETPDVQKGNGKAPLADKGSSPSPELKGACWTNTANCAGLATWKNNYAQFVSCTIYWNNGASGVSNFVLRPNGDSATYHVRTGDTTACAWGNGGVPAGAQRYFIWVS